jgi:hypothetical protein
MELITSTRIKVQYNYSDEGDSIESDDYKGSDFMDYVFKENKYTTEGNVKNAKRKKKRNNQKTFTLAPKQESMAEEEDENVDFEGSETSNNG